ncbi:MAG: Unknown protein [uncultured Sulfurovum sp.]|uniref:OpgC protein n=1 Tax=uncultured Sulfurovum sp. TaxID=269237 RepID=A0A6S6S7Q1_9BACT|nr:MAG: Unknown protein [uncultured Sulfurovum sp.]
MKDIPAMKPMGSFMKMWQYSSEEKRDLRVDFIRGFVMLILIVVHIDIFSLYNFIAWERIGAVTGAEGFVMLSGAILGLLSRKRIYDEGALGTTISKQFGRAFLLYRTSLVVILSIALLNIFIDASAAMTFKAYSGKVYNLYPDFALFSQYQDRIIAKFVMLRYGPHQFQILGLYVVLLMFSPFILWLLAKKQVLTVLTISWLIYLANSGFPVRPTGAQFEYAFPILSWQVLFVHGLVIGFYRNEIWNFFHSKKGAIAFSIIMVIYLALLFFTYNNPMSGKLPDYMRLHVIDPETFKSIYHQYFRKNTLGLGRLLNDFAILFVSYALLSYFWKPINKVFGWFFIPIGQASLYVFILHVYACVLIANIVWFQQGDIWINTLAHSLVFVLMWLMVKYKVAYNIIPR